MKKRNIILICIILAVLAFIVWYFVNEKNQHDRQVANYPVAYTELIKKYAEEFSLNPYLVLSVMRCESSLDPNAVSHRGAVGLMQLMPDTGAWAAHKLGLDDSYSEEVLTDPEWNIRLACWYIRFLCNRLGEDDKTVIAAYNAGHGNVQKWLENPEYASDGKLNVIPYEATEQYYEKVMAAYRNYTELYPDCFSSVE